MYVLYVELVPIVNILVDMDNYNKLQRKKAEDKLEICLASLYRIKDLKSLNDVHLEVSEVEKRIKAII